MVKRIYDKLTKDEKRFFQMRYFESLTQQEIADSMGVSQMTVSRMEKRLKEKFREEYYKVV